eukprot:m51a1_g12318 putative lysophosphatidic acid acyltransferase (419) ;mRNA; r:416095-417781
MLTVDDSKTPAKRGAAGTRRKTEADDTTSVLGRENSFFGKPTEQEAKELQHEAEERLEDLSPLDVKSRFRFVDLATVATDGMQSLVRDEFTQCFESSVRRPWNWNVYLWPTWILGIALRYGILLPLRFFGLSVGTCIVFGGIFLSQLFISDKARCKRILQRLTMLYASVWVMSWNGVVYFHGSLPKRRQNQVFVSNHTTIFDIAILMQHAPYSIVGQKQPGGIGFFQDRLLAGLGCLWFERRDANDRHFVSRKLKEHITDVNNNPLLMFPEGVCVNNDYCIMFKKGAFELVDDVEVCPIAIKYNKIFCDMYWNSKEQSFARHVFNLLTSWAVVCDVWYLEPQHRLPGEDPADFATRVKELIAKKAGLKITDWDGYLKYFQPSQRLLKARKDKVRESLAGIHAGVSPSVSPALAIHPVQ